MTKIVCALLAVGCSPISQAGERAKPPQDLLNSRTELSPEANAATEWKEAEPLFVPIPEESKADILIAWSLKGEKFDVSQTEHLNRWIETNRTTLALIDKGLQKDRAQIPAWDSLQPMPYAVALINLAKARLFLADQAAAKREHSTATKLLVGNLKLSQLLRDAEVPVIHYLIACSMRSMTEKAIARWAMFANPDAETIQAMLLELPGLAEEADAYERILRVEFTDFILPGLDVKRFAQLWNDSARTNKLVLQLQPEELQRPLLIVHDPKLVAVHPKPLDTEKQIRFYESRFRRYAANAKGAWNNRDTSLATETEALRAKFLADLKPLLKATRNAKLPLSNAAAKKAAEHYVKLDNPVGRYWQSTDDALARSHVRVSQARTERAATRAILAIRLYQIKKGNLPPSLEDLVVAGLVQTVPVDEFANAPLHYSRDKHILWSVAEDGVNDGGISGASFWQDKDAVWTLAPR